MRIYLIAVLVLSALASLADANAQANTIAAVSPSVPTNKTTNKTTATSSHTSGKRTLTPTTDQHATSVHVDPNEQVPTPKPTTTRPNGVRTPQPVEPSDFEPAADGEDHDEHGEASDHEPTDENASRTSKPKPTTASPLWPSTTKPPSGPVIIARPVEMLTSQPPSATPVTQNNKPAHVGPTQAPITLVPQVGPSTSTSTHTRPETPKPSPVGPTVAPITQVPGATTPKPRAGGSKTTKPQSSPGPASAPPVLTPILIGAVPVPTTARPPAIATAVHVVPQTIKPVPTTTTRKTVLAL